jgi:sugar O-acyltransferase (sialic acid O-acetyltransferase NeuD family)
MIRSTTLSSERIAVYGGGGFAREVAWLVQCCADAGIGYELVCFIEDDSSRQGRVVNGLETISLEEAWHRFPDARVVGAVGSPSARERIAMKAATQGFEFTSVIHPRVERSRWVEIGIGTLVCAGNTLTTNIVLGTHVQINLHCTVGHDAVLGDYTTLAPGVHISGWVRTGRRVYIGTGAVIINGTEQAPIVLGDDVIVGAGACVTQSVEPGLTVVGVPAKPLSRPAPKP